jgi:methionyl aminopeptidase
MILDRNEICWCGSGLKYKKCHLEFDEKIESFKRKGHIVPPRDIIKSQKDIE